MQVYEQDKQEALMFGEIIGWIISGIVEWFCFGRNFKNKDNKPKAPKKKYYDGWDD